MSFLVSIVDDSFDREFTAISTLLVLVTTAFVFALEFGSATPAGDPVDYPVLVGMVGSTVGVTAAYVHTRRTTDE